MRLIGHYRSCSGFAAHPPISATHQILKPWLNPAASLVVGKQPLIRTAMLSQYSWGQFFVFVLGLLVVYYLVVIIRYYRIKISALLSGRKLVGPQQLDAGSTNSKARRSRAEAVEDDLVSATSAYTAPAAAPEPPVASTEPGAGAADNLTGGQAQIVAGTVPDSVAATGENVGATELATSENAGGSATAEAAQEDEVEEIELLPDEVSDEDKMRLMEVVSSEKTINDENNSEKLTIFVDNDDDIAYDAVASAKGNELEPYEVPVASSLNIITEQPSIYAADDINAYLTELQDAQDESALEMSAKFAGTTLGIAEAYSNNKAAAEAEISKLFSM